MTNPILIILPLFLEIQAGRTNSWFPKTFLGDISVFVEYLYNRSPEMGAKIFKNYISILAIVN